MVEEEANESDAVYAAGSPTKVNETQCREWIFTLQAGGQNGQF